MNDVEYGLIRHENENNNNGTPHVKNTMVILGREINMTPTELKSATFLALFFFFNWSYYALFPPIFPKEAIKKGMSETQIGFIFGIFQLTLFLCYPIFGKYLNAIGIKFLFVSGVLLSAGGAISFGFLDRAPNGLVYFIMCLMCRTVTGIGASMGISYAIVVHSFPNNVASVVAVLEFVSGIGFMVGPVLGGFLYEIGGFELPYLLISGFMLVLFIFAVFFFPEDEQTPKSDTELVQNNEPTSLPILPLLKIPQFTVTLLTMFVACIGINFIEPNLQIHLLPLQLEPYQLGFVFFVPAITYAAFTPIVGFICDKYPDMMPYLIMASSCISVIAYSILGPLPYINLPLNLPIFLSGYFLFGLSYTGVMVPVYSELTKIAAKRGYPNDLRTQGLISGIFSGAHSLAAFIGPMCGGIVVQTLGFRETIFSLIIMFLIVGSLYSIVYFKYEANELDDCSISEDNPNAPLLVDGKLD